MFELKSIKIKRVEHKLDKKAVKEEVLESDNVSRETKHVAEAQALWGFKRAQNADEWEIDEYEGDSRNFYTVNMKNDTGDFIKMKRKNKKSPSKKKNENRRRK